MTASRPCPSHAHHAARDKKHRRVAFSSRDKREEERKKKEEEEERKEKKRKERKVEIFRGGVLPSSFRRGKIPLPFLSPISASGRVGG